MYVLDIYKTYILLVLLETINVFLKMFPKLKYGHLLAVPTGPKKKDPVVYFVKETNKIPDVLDLSQIW